MDARRAFQAYEAVRGRLPDPPFLTKCRRAPDLLSIADQFDVIVFDAFGVLNVGEMPIAGAKSCVQSLRHLGKQVFVLTNGASHDRAMTHEKFKRLGYDFTIPEIISSRKAAERALLDVAPSALWGVAAAAGFSPDQLPVDCIVLEDALEPYQDAEAVLFLSSSRWTPNRQTLLLQELQKRPRPVIIANPDIVAPREDGFSIEPGFFGHQICDLSDADVFFYGKPFPGVYDMVRLAIDPAIDPNRVAMIGDTLHTDVLGGRSAGWTTILATDHGLFRSLPYQDFIDESGIIPDWIMPGI